ncbi:MAG: hypothetical protein WCP79_02045 [Bacillota bacterium]
MKKSILFSMLILVTLFLSAPVSAAMDYTAIIERESQWIASLQQPSGAIVMTRNRTVTWNNNEYYKIDPYNANLAVTGLLTNPSPGTVAVARNWINWYLTHLNTNDYNKLNGTIYTYLADPKTGAEYSTNTYDATDSYAATFLSLLKVYAKVSRDTQYLAANRATIESIAGAMLATMQSDGMTYAKPDNQKKYLMDNCEVFSGLAGIAYLESEVFNDNKKARGYNNQRDAVQKAIETRLWNSNTQNYDQTAGVPSSWLTFYPDTVSQMYPIWNGVIPANSPVAKNLYGQLCLSFPGWPSIDTTDNFACAMVSYSAAMIGDQVSVDIFLANVRNRYIDQNHPWPWYNAEAAFAIGAAAMHISPAPPPENEVVPAVMVGAAFLAFGPRRW